MHSLYIVEQVWLRCYKGYFFPIPKHRIPTYLFKVRVERGFNEGFLSSITKEIITTKDDVYNFAKNFESRGYGDLGKRKSKKSG